MPCFSALPRVFFGCSVRAFSGLAGAPRLAGTGAFVAVMLGSVGFDGSKGWSQAGTFVTAAAVTGVRLAIPLLAHRLREATVLVVDRDARQLARLTRAVRATGLPVVAPARGGRIAVA